MVTASSDRTLKRYNLDCQALDATIVKQFSMANTNDATGGGADLAVQRANYSVMAHEKVRLKT